jgi:hypothetical protein
LKISKDAVDCSSTELINHIKNRLSVTLQLGNANILLESMQKLHMIRYENEVKLYNDSNPQRQYCYNRTKTNTIPQVYTRPANSNTLQTYLNHTINDHPLGKYKSVNSNCIEKSNVQIDFTNSIDSADTTFSVHNDSNKHEVPILAPNEEALVNRSAYFNFDGEYKSGKWRRGIEVIAEFSPSLKRKTTNTTSSKSLTTLLLTL